MKHIGYFAVGLLFISLVLGSILLATHWRQVVFDEPAVGFYPLWNILQLGLFALVFSIAAYVGFSLVLFVHSTGKELVEHFKSSAGGNKK